MWVCTKRTHVRSIEYKECTLREMQVKFIDGARDAVYRAV